MDQFEGVQLASADEAAIIPPKEAKDKTGEDVGEEQLRRAKRVGCVYDVMPIGLFRKRRLVIKGQSEVIILVVFVKLERAVSSSTQEVGRGFQAPG
jgi:hypothetical protein